jgi:hypothetical protein
MCLSSQFKLKLVTALVCLITSTTYAQIQEPESAEPAAPEVLMLNCEIENPEDLANSELLGNYSVKPRSAVKLGISPAEGLVVVSMQLSAGRFSLTPSKPRIYKARIKSKQQLEGGKLILKNADLDETDHVSVLLSNSSSVEGVISTYGAQLKIICSSSEDN